MYKKRPAIVRSAGERIEIELQDNERLKVRLKDIELLHPGPFANLSELIYPAGELEIAWEILRTDEQLHTLAEFAELAYGKFTPVTAWAAWLELEDGLFFTGTPTAIRARSAEEVASERHSRRMRAEEAQSWADFLYRARLNRLDPGSAADRRYLREIEELALGRRSDSRALHDLGHAERPEAAHAWLLEHRIWDEFVDPYPARLGLPTSPVDLPVVETPAEERRDLTHLPAYAIDDQGNQDPDDAISLDGNKLWVHVADASALVPPGSPLDLEACTRGANLYLPPGTVGMLPAQAVQILGMGLNAISPALSFGMVISPGSELQETEILPTWVRVQRLTYESAEVLLEQEPLQSLYHLAQEYRARRLASGAVEIDLPEAIIHLVDGQVAIQPVRELRSRQLVKEAMLLAGEAAARFALAHGLAFPFTIQEPPDPVYLEEILNRLPASRLAEPGDLALAHALRRAQKRSQVSSQPAPHAGLGLSFYARVTSPLRRYPDLVAHQQLRAYLSGAPTLDEQTLLERLGQAEMSAALISQAEYLSRRHWTLVYLLQNPGWKGEAILVDKRQARGRVILPELALETQVHLHQDVPLNSRLMLTFKGANLPELDAHFEVH
jgi:exoribonuclease-2